MRPHGRKARVSTTNPVAFAMCDRCGDWRNRTDLVWQYQWGGNKLYNVQILVCEDRCYDIPQEQLRTIILPPDPPPVINARVPDFAYEEQTVMITQFGSGYGNWTQQDSDFNGDFSDAFGPPPVETPTGVGIAQRQPPWGAGPQLMMCDQTGEQVLLLQYTTSS